MRVQDRIALMVVRRFAGLVVKRIDDSNIFSILGVNTFNAGIDCFSLLVA